MPSTPQTDHVARGIKAEEPIIRLYIGSLPGPPSYTRPAIVVHPSLPYVVCSPDAVATFPTTQGAEKVLIEVKTSVNRSTENVLTDCNDQIQLGMLVTGCTRALLLHFNAPLSKQPSQAMFQDGSFTALPVASDSEWVTKFLQNAPIFYEMYLSWYHTNDLDRGTRALALLHGKPGTAKVAWK
jgi:hypothetical protein